MRNTSSAGPLTTPQVDKTFVSVSTSGSKTLATNFSLAFKAYAHQGELYLFPHKAHGARLFVNGTEVSLGDLLLHDDGFKLDISDLTINGINSVQISGLCGGEAKVRVQVPWPTIIGMHEDADPALPQNERVAGILSRLELLDTMLRNDIARGFPGAQLCVVWNGQLIKSSSYGYKKRYDCSGAALCEDELELVDKSTLFDLASITKMLASNMAVQKLVYEKKLSIDQRVSDFLPMFCDPHDAKIKGKGSLTIRQLLEHQAGFQPDTQFFDESFDKYEGAKEGVNGLFAQEKAKTIQRICSELPLSYVPGSQTQYSDTDYMIIGLIVEKVTGMDLDAYVESSIYKPLGLDHVVFNPLKKGFSRGDVAATELDGNGFSGTVDFVNMRSYTLQGEVHDPKAWYCMDGVSGHAGLFGNAEQMAVLGQLMLNGGGYGSVAIFDKSTTSMFIKPKDSDPTFGLGWRREADDGYSPYFSNVVSPNSFGHTGWTGTLILIDPDNDLVIVYLTNKLHTQMASPERVVFGGTQYLSGQLGMIPSLVCSALKCRAENIPSLFCSMLRWKVSLMAQGVDDTDIDKNVAQSMVETLKSIAQTCGDVDKSEIEHTLSEVEASGLLVAEG